MRIVYTINEIYEMIKPSLIKNYGEITDAIFIAPSSTNSNTATITLTVKDNIKVELPSRVEGDRKLDPDL